MKERVSRLIEIRCRDDEVYKEMILSICRNYHLNCKDSPEDVINILKKHGVIREIEPWIFITGVEIDTEKLREKKQEILDELDNLDVYVIVITQSLPYFYSVISVETWSDLDIILDVLEKRQIIEY